MKQGSFVLIVSDVLPPDQRAASLPMETKQTPLRQWLKGTLVKDANLGELATVRTQTGRLVQGTLLEVHPRFQHSFGEYVPELALIRTMIDTLMPRGAIHE